MGVDGISLLKTKTCLVRAGGTVSLLACKAGQREEGTELLTTVGGLFMPKGGTIFGSTKDVGIDAYLVTDKNPNHQTPFTRRTYQFSEAVLLPLVFVRAVVREALDTDKPSAVKKVTIPAKK